MALARKKKWMPQYVKPAVGRGYKKYFLVILVVLLCGGIYFFFSRTMQADGFELHTGPSLSSVLHDEVARNLEQYTENGYRLSQIKESLWKTFGALGSVSLSLTPRQCIEVVVQSATPKIIINGLFVLNDRKMIVPYDHYNSEYLMELPSIEVLRFEEANAAAWAHEYYDFLTSLDISFFKQFQLTIENSYHIEAHDLIDPGWRLITSLEYKLTPRLITRYTQIKKEQILAKSGAYIDARFEGMLVFGKYSALDPKK